MSEIIVFQPPSKDDVSLTKTERELLYEGFAKTSPLDFHHFEAFYDMETEEINAEIVDSTVVSIMFKYISYYVFPIVEEIPPFKLKTFKRGVARNKKPQKEYISKDYYFTTQFTENVKGFTKDGLPIMLIPGNSYKVSGAVIPEILSKDYDKAVPVLSDSIDVFDLTDTGSFGIKNFNDVYTQDRPHFVRPSNKNSKNKIIFKSDEDALKTIKDIIKLIEDKKELYERYHSSVYTSIHNDIFLKIRDTKARNSKESDSRKKVPVNQDVLKVTPEIKKVKELYAGEFSTIPNRFYYNLHNNNMADLFYKINLMGLGHDMSQDIVDKHEEMLNIQKNLQKQNKEKDNNLLEFTKKQTISMKQFGLTMNKLNPKQLQNVEREYKKIKQLEVTRKEIPHISRAVANLYMSIDDLNFRGVKMALKKINSELDIDYFKLHEQKEMIKNADGVSVVCPHILLKASKMLNYETNVDNLTQIRDDVINNFALPDTSCGYNCRICGALLAERDDEKIVEFLAGVRVVSRAEISERQKSIWKEVSHILSTFVKFRDPVNLSKIATSITDSIKSELFSIEMKLMKIRTITNDSIKDLMHIYTAVYAYAVLIQMIHLNYGKITFVSPGMRFVKARGGLEKGGNAVLIFATGADESDDSSSDDQSGDDQSGDDQSGDDQSGDDQSGDDQSNNETPILEVMGMEDCHEVSPYLEMLDLEPDPEPDAKGGEKSGDKFNHKDRPRKKFKTKRFDKKFLKKEDTKRLQNIFQIALEIIIKSKSSVINNLSNLSQENIKPLLVKAYQWVLSLKSAESSEEIVRMDNTEDFLKIDPVFSYITYINAIYGKSDGTVKDLLGRDLAKIEQEYKDGITLYETMPLVKIPDKTDREKYMKGSYEYVYDYVINKLYLHDEFPVHEDVAKFEKKFEFLKELDEKFIAEEIKKKLNPIMHYKIEPTEDPVIQYNKFKKESINIFDHYCPNGEKHKFDIFVFHKASADGVLNSKDSLEVTQKQLHKWYSSEDPKVSELLDYYLVDEKCSKCDVYYSSLKKKDATDLEKKLETLDKLKEFYDYYEDRCPEKNLHDYGMDNKKNIDTCTNCGYTRKFMEDLDNKYYQKYKSKYQEVLDEQKRFDDKLLEEFKKLNQTAEEKSEKGFEWKVSNKSILELSRATGIKYNMIVNLGLSEGRKYENIEKEVENPHISSTEEEDILRNLYLRDYCLWLLRLYYLVKNYNIFMDVDEEFKKIMEVDIDSLKKQLPDIYDQFNEKYDYFFRNLEPKLLSNFLLDYLCKGLLAIRVVDLKNWGEKFVKYVMDNIIKSERDVSKPPPLSIIIDKRMDAAQDVNIDEAYSVSDEEAMGLDTEDLDDFRRDHLDFDMSDGMEENFNASFIDQ